MDIYTAQYRYAGPNRLDITVSNKNDAWGRVFAPTWDMVTGHKNGTLSDEDYTYHYHVLMRSSTIHDLEQWRRFVTLDRVVLVCFCPPGAFCHRVVLANMIQPIAPHFTYHGEIAV
jgi:uncharacterized protein YeaO (DUF488 family)